MVYEHDFEISLEDIDKNSYMTNKAILHYFENSATYHSDSVGFGIKNVEKTCRSWIMLEWKVKILKRIKYGEKIKIRTWSRSIIKFFAYRDYELINEAGEICVIGTSKWALFDINKRRVTVVSDEEKNKYESEDRCVFEDKEIEKISIPEDFENEITYKVLRRDIDFNGHVHNLYHFDLAYEVLPEDIYNNSTFDNFRVSYKKEIKLEDTVVSKYSFYNNKHVVVLTNNNNEIYSLVELW